MKENIILKLKQISLCLLLVFSFNKTEAQCYGSGHLLEFNLTPNTDSNCDTIIMDTVGENIDVTFYLYLGNDDYIYTKSGKLESYPYRLLTFKLSDTSLQIIKDVKIKSKIRYYHDPYRYSRPLGDKYDDPDKKIYKTNYFKLTNTSFFNDSLEFYYPLYENEKLSSLLFIFNGYAKGKQTWNNASSICIYNVVNQLEPKLCYCMNNIGFPTLSSIDLIKKKNNKHYFFAAFQDVSEYYFYILII